MARNNLFTILWDAGKALFNAIGVPQFVKSLSNGPGILSSVSGKYLGTNLTGAELEANEFTTSEREASQQWAEDMYNKYQSPQAQIASQMQGFRDNGINPALMYGGSGPSAGSLPSASAGSSVSPNTSALLTSLLDMALQRKRLSIDEKRVDNDYKLGLERNRIVAELNPSRIQANVATAWRNMTAGNLNDIDANTRSSMNSARISLMLSQCDSEAAEAALKRSGISVNEAKLGLIAQQALNLTIANKYADSYWQAEIALKRAQEQNNYSAANKAYNEIVKIQEDAKNSALFGEILNQQFEMNEFDIEMKRFTKEHQNADWLLEKGFQASQALSGGVMAASSLSRAGSYSRSVTAGMTQVIPYGAFGY